MTTFNEIEWRRKVKLAESGEELRNFLMEVPVDYNGADVENSLQAKAEETAKGTSLRIARKLADPH